MSRSHRPPSGRESSRGRSRAHDRRVARRLQRPPAFSMELLMSRFTSIAVLLALVGCSDTESGEYDTNLGAVDTDAEEPAEGDADAAIDTWRIDVFPAFGTQAGERDILPHSFSTTVGGTDHDLILAPGVRVEGVVTAYQVGPLATSTLPGVDEPVNGTLSLRIEESV